MDTYTYEEERVVDGCLQIRTTYIGEAPKKNGWRVANNRTLTSKYLKIKAKYEMLIDIVNTDGIEDE